MENLGLRERLPGRIRIDELLSGRDFLQKCETGRGTIGITTGTRIRKVKIPGEAAAKSRILSKAKEPLTAGKEIIKGLEKIGLKAKPFCMHKQKNGEKSFIVQGENFKWVVAPIADYRKPEEIPSEMFRKLAVLKKHRIKYGGIAIAFPMKGKAVERIDEELKAMADSFSRLAGAIGSLAALPFTIIAEISDELAKDPVLLVKFGSFKGYDLHIELGRWE